MTFWQENYGFVKEVYDYRMAKYQEWMDNLEAIVTKVLAPNVQYTYKEFRNIRDTLGSLCRDLDKEGMKEWLDMMLEKVSMRVSEDGLSARDKQFKETEKQRLSALIERHDGLMPKTLETQEKVEIFSMCYSFGDDISQVMKTLEEMLHLSTKPIHPHNIKMVEEQIEKADKVVSTIDSVTDHYEEFIKRGQKLLKIPNCAPFLEPLIEKLEEVYKKANIKSKERVDMLSHVVKDWETYDDLRKSIGDPLEKLETEYSKLRKIYDPAVAEKKLLAKKILLDECKNRSASLLDNIKKCYTSIVVIAGKDKKEFLDREVAEVEEKRNIIKKFEEKLIELNDYNQKLTKVVNQYKEINDWAKPAAAKLKEVCGNPNLDPEERVNEIVCLQAEGNARLPKLNPLEFDINAIITVEDLESSETARIFESNFRELKKFIHNLMEDVNQEAGNISQDQKYFAEYITTVKDVKPFIEQSEFAVKQPMSKPQRLDDALALLTQCQEFDQQCINNKQRLDGAGKARKSMGKPSTAENLYEPLSQKYIGLKKASEDRIAKVAVLVNTWRELQRTSEVLAEKMSEVPRQDEPNIAELERVFNSMKGVFQKKKDLLAKI